MQKKEVIFDGNEKRFFSTDDEDKVVVSFKDIATAFHGIKRATFPGKGAVNNKISALLFRELAKAGIDTHFVDVVAENEQLCRKITIIPIEITVHNYIAGPLALTLGVEEGFKPENVVIDMAYNNDALGDPPINEDHAVALGLVSYEELNNMLSVARKANEVLKNLFNKAGIKLVDFKLEFGRAMSGEIIMSDEISPDTCRLWDMETDDILDKDRFRHDLGYILDAYEKVYNRLVKVV